MDIAVVIVESHVPCLFVKTGELRKLHSAERFCIAQGSCQYYVGT